jgi:molybdopterin converting factor small subunit
MTLSTQEPRKFSPIDDCPIRVTVSGVSALREIIGKNMVVVLRNHSTVRDLMEELEKNCGSVYKEKTGEELTYSIRKRFSLLMNGIFMSPEEALDRLLSDGDEIMFFQLAGA